MGISKVAINRIRAALWYAIGTHRTLDCFCGSGTARERTAAERALHSMPGDPTLAQARRCHRKAVELAGSAMDRYKKFFKVTCMTGHRIMGDLSLAEKSLNKHEEKLNGR